MAGLPLMLACLFAVPAAGDDAALAAPLPPVSSVPALLPVSSAPPNPSVSPSPSVTAPSGVPAAEPAMKPHPLIRTGETLSYRIGWGFITAGYGTLEVLPLTEHDGIPAWQFVLSANTTPFVDKLYKVRDRYETWVAADMSHALEYNQAQHEGSAISDLHVIFDWVAMEARRTRNDEAKKPVKIQPGTFDPLSALFAFRTQTFKLGDTITIPVSDGKFFVSGTAKVIAEEKIETPAGEFDTYKIEPDIKDLAGVFKKSKGAKIFVWVTRDRQHIPVKVSSKVYIGSFFAELTGIERRIDPPAPKTATALTPPAVASQEKDGAGGGPPATAPPPGVIPPKR